jgi:archaellum component FlaF (FlaF/FlaG flagellin family)
VLALRLKSKKAVSTIVATIIMVNIAVVLGVTAYLYQQNMLGVMIGNYEIYVDRNKEIKQERISDVNIRYDETNPYRLNITVVNSGSRHVWISAIYLNETDILNEIYNDGTHFAVWNSTGGFQEPDADGQYLIVVGDSLTFSFQPIDGGKVGSIAYGNVQSFTVVTLHGVKDQQEWLATRAV